MLLIPLLLLIGLALAYSNSFHGPFIFDDLDSIPNNPSIHDLPRSIIPVFYGAAAVTGRPVVNFSLAVNYALGGLSVEGYHLMNFGIHLLAALVLFGFLRRTLQLPSFTDSIRCDAFWIAGSIAILWSLHPLQTESVTYIVERSESLMSLFYLLTLYCFLRSKNSFYPNAWLFISIVCCYCGVGSKEVMVSAPLIVCLYDWIFIERKFQTLWKTRRWYYWGLLLSWTVLAFLVVFSERRGGEIGVGHITPAEYALTQAWALCHYLKLAIWPDPLVFDYGIFTVTDFWRVIPCGLVLLFILVGGVGLFWRKLQWGFWGIWILCLLAPTSSVVPIQPEPVSEHRVYLALGSLLFYLILGVHQVMGRRVLVLSVLIGAIFTFQTYQRNNDFQSMESIWSKTVSQVPQNERAHNSYAEALVSVKKWDEAEREFQKAIELEPGFYAALSNYGSMYEKQGKLKDAEKMFRRALQANPFSSKIWYNFGYVLEKQGDLSESIQAYQQSLILDPHLWNSMLNLGKAYFKQKDFLRAEEMYRRCISANPDCSAGYAGLAQILDLKGDFDGALLQYENALRLDSSVIETRYFYVQALEKKGRLREALGQIKEVIQLSPNKPDLKIDLANLLFLNHEVDSAIAVCKQLVREGTNNSAPYLNWGGFLESQGKWGEAESVYLEALQNGVKDPIVWNRIGEIQQKIIGH